VSLLPGAQIAQLVEHATENRSVAGSIPALGTISFLKPFVFRNLSLFRALRLSDRVTTAWYNALQARQIREAFRLVSAAISATDSG